MGADLIIAHTAFRKDAELDWEAGENAIRNLTEDHDGVQDLLDNYPDDDFDWRTHLENQLGVLADGMDTSRDAQLIQFGEWVILVAGGTSWGDDPPEGPVFTALNDLGYVDDEVLGAVGFRWPQPPREDDDVQLIPLDSLERDVVADSMEALLDGNLDDETAMAIRVKLRGPL